MNKELLELYSDYLLSSFGATTATGLSAMLDDAVSHDRVTRFLSQDDYDSRTLWLLVKHMVRAMQSPDGVLIFDDTIQEKPHTDENEIVNWHFDHSKGRSVKGINILNCVYHSEGATMPVAFEIVRKTIEFMDERTGRLKRRSETTKNELMRRMLRVCEQNRIEYRYVLADSWFSSKENMEFIRCKLDKQFVIAVKPNRTAVLSYAAKLEGNFQRIDSLGLAEREPVRVWLRGAGLQGSPASPGLYEQRWQHGNPVSGVQRVGRCGRGHLRDLPQKVESGDLSQDAQGQCRPCQVAD